MEKTDCVRMCFNLPKDIANTLEVIVQSGKKTGQYCTKSQIVTVALVSFINSISKEYEEIKNESK